jgi:hypothetical protein
MQRDEAHQRLLQDIADQEVKTARPMLKSQRSGWHFTADE